MAADIIDSNSVNNSVKIDDIPSNERNAAYIRTIANKYGFGYNELKDHSIVLIPKKDNESEGHSFGLVYMSYNGDDAVYLFGDFCSKTNVCGLDKNKPVSYPTVGDAVSIRGYPKDTLFYRLDIIDISNYLEQLKNICEKGCCENPLQVSGTKDRSLDFDLLECIRQKRTEGTTSSFQTVYLEITKKPDSSSVSVSKNPEKVVAV